MRMAGPYDPKLSKEGSVPYSEKDLQEHTYHGTFGKGYETEIGSD